MGTNYYAVGAGHPGMCEHCTQHNRESHICKSLRTFRAHTRGNVEPITGNPVTSWQDWRAILTSPAVSHVIDEYDQRIEASDFIARVEAIPRWNRDETWQQFTRDHHHHQDDDGYTFLDVEFC